MELDMNWHDLIALDPQVFRGKPVLRGTRLAADPIVETRALGPDPRPPTTDY